MQRIIDVTVSLTLLLLFSPILIAVALAVWIDSPGPVFYRASRCGKGGRLFRMWKFRTMITGADRSGAITGRNDSRITRMGSLLRRTKLDELPQFLNVLVGDMTLVGPRPESPDIVAIYTPWQRQVVAVKPGVTGRVQLESREESDSIPEGADPRQYYLDHLMQPKLEMDLAYLKVRTSWSDARILGETTLYVLRCLSGKLLGSNPATARQAAS
jgi:lipopolysaccharide/colanic/teichoic acid biosynthesis glycosyltransferase